MFVLSQDQAGGKGEWVGLRGLLWGMVTESLAGEWCPSRELEAMKEGGGLHPEQTPSQDREEKCKGPEVGACLLHLGNWKVFIFTVEQVAAMGAGSGQFTRGGGRRTGRAYKRGALVPPPVCCGRNRVCCVCRSFEVSVGTESTVTG